MTIGRRFFVVDLGKQIDLVDLGKQIDQHRRFGRFAVWDAPVSRCWKINKRHPCSSRSATRSQRKRSSWASGVRRTDIPPANADQARKMIAATIWEITKRLAPFSSDTDEATIQRIADKAVKQRHNIAKRYADIA